MADFDPVAYINQLNLGIDDLPVGDLAGLAVDDLVQAGGAIGDASRGGASAYVVGNEVISFLGNISLQHQV